MGRDFSRMNDDITDPSLEFDIFEMLRLRLSQALTDGDHEPAEAERIALYLVEGIRHVPAFLRAVQESGSSREELLERMKCVLEAAPALTKAWQLWIEPGGADCL